MLWCSRWKSIRETLLNWKPCSGLRRPVVSICRSCGFPKVSAVFVAKVASLGQPGATCWYAQRASISCLNRRHDFPRHAQAIDDVVPSDLVGHGAEERRQCAGAATSSRFGQLRDRLDMVAQIATSHGPAQP